MEKATARKQVTEIKGRQKKTRRITMATTSRGART